VVVCEEVSKKINVVNTLKICKAPYVLMKIQSMEAAFPDAHDWMNNTGVGVLERDGQVTFEEAAKNALPTTMISRRDVSEGISTSKGLNGHTFCDHGGHILFFFLARR
jgi:hypothetical protein